MEHFGKPKPPTFEMRSVIEQKPFESPAVQSFFTEWCEINDSIEPKVIKRDEWEKRRIQGILEKRPDDKQTLYIPEDLQLWEMVGVMETVDHDTFAARPERRTEAKEKLLALGKTFQNTGAYIAQRLEGIYEGREIAQALSQELYEYGHSLVEGKGPETLRGIDDIARQRLTPEETEVVDRFLAGDTLYASRKRKAERATAHDRSRQGAVYEAERQKTLTQFFKVAEKAFALRDKSRHEASRKNTMLREGDTPIHSAFLSKIEEGLAQKIETPQRELHMAMFRRGLEKLTREMREYGWRPAVDNLFDAQGRDLQSEQRKLIDVLNISTLKTELATLRESGDTARISAKEREIADKIQKAVSNFPFRLNAHNPSEMVATQYINCVGASTLGGALMKEAGLQYLVGEVPEHSILFLVTSDGQVEWRDMLDPSYNEHLTDAMIKGRKTDGEPLTLADIVGFSHQPTPEGLRFDVDSERYRQKVPGLKEDQRQYVTVFEPEYGQQIQLLNNTGSALRRLGRPAEAVVAYRLIIGANQKYAYAYYGLGNALRALGHHKEAVVAYRQAIGIDPKDAYPYNGLGNALRALGRPKEAVEAYETFIEKADKELDDVWIRRAKRIIAEIKE